MQKRFSYLLLTMLVTAFSIAGCSNDSNSDPSSTASLEETTENPAFFDTWIYENVSICFNFGLYNK